MGLLKGMSELPLLEPFAPSRSQAKDLSKRFLSPGPQNDNVCHKMLCFFFGKTKDFVKITFDKWSKCLYNI